jgi:cytochrome d ubiquinol oxidase subunit II
MVVAWFLVILLCLFMYVVFDGYDLGIGIGSLFERGRDRKREMVEVVATTWDGNETWLVLLAVSLWGGFPTAFGVLLPHLYLPIIVTLFALIVRGASVEFISQDRRASQAWLWAFGIASLTAAFAEGFALGTLTAGSPVVDDTAATTGTLPWFGLVSGAAFVVTALALGYAYLKRKSGGGLRQRASQRGTAAAVAAVLLIAVTFIAINATDAPLDLSTGPRLWSFWVLLGFGGAGVLATAVTIGRLRASGRADAVPFLGLAVAVGAVLLAFTVARYPVLLPPDLTLTRAASPDTSLWFLIIGVGANIPLVIIYHWYMHHVFRRRVGDDGAVIDDGPSLAPVRTGESS